ncbi:hypothetical protein E2C01_092956 [Portunus trituberculatus]|uniref:Uncharacterized protein n=1 Tax=Portunus trituberculatus TaxID=210409 RepID=A0A5B7JNK2_PORTR|nr:hypothetical protein [Portunus trituberculatus]
MSVWPPRHDRVTHVPLCQLPITSHQRSEYSQAQTSHQGVSLAAAVLGQASASVGRVREAGVGGNTCDTSTRRRTGRGGLQTHCSASLPVQ